MFNIISEAYAITRCNGLFRQVQVFLRNDNEIYIRHSNGFARVMRDNKTSIPLLMIDEICLPFKLQYNPIGYAFKSLAQGYKDSKGIWKATR